MRNLSFADARHTNNNSVEKEQLSPILRNAATIQVQYQIKQKIKTFANWSFTTSVRKKKRLSSLHRKDSINKQQSNSFLKQLLKNIIEKKQEKSKKRKGKKLLQIQQLQGIKTERRQRLKKIQNPVLIIQHYMTKQGFKPSEEEHMLLGRIIKMKEKVDTIHPFNLEFILQHIYKTMNIAVDLNQTRFLILLIVMAGQICFEAKEMKSAFFFFTQAFVASTCTRMWAIKLESLIYLGKICMEIIEYGKAIIFLKKSLQYAWKIKDFQTELRLYDLIGQCFNYEGMAELAIYYHNRYILGEIESNESAVKRISFEMLNQYLKSLDNAEQENLSNLFIQYLRLPITNFAVYPPTKSQKIYPNYTDERSPRKNRQSMNLDIKQLPETNTQIEKILSQLIQFQTEIPNPDLHQNFIPREKYALKRRKKVQFQQSNDFYKIVGINVKPIDKSVLKLPIDEQVDKVLSQTSNNNWWEDILTRTKKQRSQHLGSIRNKIQKTHQSYHKYPEERKRAQSLKQQKINQTMNKTILNWIDPSRLY